MKRILLLLILSLFYQLFAIEASESRIIVSAEIPEDSGIVFPENVVHLDRLYFSFGHDTTSLLSTYQLEAGVMEPGLNEFRFSLLYYGNQSEDYRIKLETDAGEGWVNGNGKTIPIVSRVEDSTDTDDISVNESNIGSAAVTVPARGPRSGEAVADIVLEWSGNADPEPGTYTVDLDIRMYAI